MARWVTGEQLRHDLLNLELTRKPIITDLIYERDIFLLSSDAGAGKSVFAAQLAICLSFKRSFCGLEIPEAKKVLYIQLEGDYEENIERMREMEREGGIIIEESNMLWVEEKGLDVLDNESLNRFFTELDDSGFIPEVVIIDPIYKLSGQDISTGVAALGVIRFSDALYDKFKCTNVLIHHNTKESYHQGKKIVKDDGYYGHSFIKNHIRSSYSLKITGQYTRTLERKKGRGSDTRRSIDLDFNPETWCLEASGLTEEHKKGKHFDRFYAFLNQRHKENKATTANEILEECEITYNQLRTLKKKKETTDLFVIQKTQNKNKEIWLPKI